MNIIYVIVQFEDNATDSHPNIPIFMGVQRGLADLDRNFLWTHFKDPSQHSNPEMRERLPAVMRENVKGIMRVHNGQIRTPFYILEVES